MNKELIAKELMKIAEELTGGKMSPGAYVWQSTFKKPYAVRGLYKGVHNNLVDSFEKFEDAVECAKKIQDATVYESVSGAVLYKDGRVIKQANVLMKLAKNLTADNIQKFQVGKTYSCRSIGDADCIYKYKIVSRTDSTVTIKSDTNETIKRNVQVSDGMELIYPEGKYSMAPILRAKSIVASKKELTAENKKIDIYDNGKYVCSTTWSKTCAEAVDVYCKKYKIDNNSNRIKAYFSK